MTTLLKIASQVFVRTFYTEHISFFLLVLAIAGGFMRATEHVALAEFFVSKPYLVSIPFLFWTCYGLKIQNFNATCIGKPVNSFFFQAMLLPKGTLLLITGVVAGIQLSPALLYGIFLIATAANHALYDSVFLLIGCLAFLWTMLMIHFNQVIQHPDEDKKTSRFIRMINQLIIRPYPFFVVEWLSRKKTFTLAGIKIFSTLILVAVSKLYTTDVYDFRLMTMGLLIAIGANAQLVFEAHRFENYHFPILRQLPIPFWKRMFFILVSLGLIILPEAGIFITYYPSYLTLPEMLQGLTFLLAGLFFLYGLLYKKKLDPDTFIKMVFGCIMVGFVLCLFKVPVWSLTTLICLLSFHWHAKNYYRFEYPE